MKRIAVSVLLTSADCPGELYLVLRNQELSFFGGYLAFPGGTLDEQDYTTPVSHLSSSCHILDTQPAAFLAAAARELFEETGVWAGRGARRIAPDRLAAHRRKILRGELLFQQALEMESHIVDARDFTSVCRITTPPFAPKRYDTWFFRYRMPRGIVAEVWPGELDHGEFCSAAEALRRWRCGEVLIVPPVVIMLQEMARRGEKGFLRAVRKLTRSYDEGKLHQVHFTCGVILAPLKTQTRPPATHTNSYIVGHQRLYLVDPGSELREEQEKLWDLLDELAQAGRKLDAILLTHHHPDHVGAAEACRNRYGVPLLAHRETALRVPHLKIDGFLEDRQELDLGVAPDGTSGWRLSVYHLPGHAPGHLCFKESRYGAVIVGDLVSTLSSVLIHPQEGDMAEYVKSLRLLKSLAGGTLYPGHGPAARTGRVVVEQAIRHRLEREQKLVAALEAGPQPLEALLKRVYDDVDPAAIVLARESLLSGLIKLEREGRIGQSPSGYYLT